MLKAFIESDHEISYYIARSILTIDLAKRNLIQDPKDRERDSETQLSTKNNITFNLHIITVLTS